MSIEGTLLHFWLLIGLAGHIGRARENLQTRSFDIVYGTNYRADTTVISNFVNVSLTQCASSCKDTCQGFNFRQFSEALGDCSLLSVEGALSRMVAEYGTKYYERTDHRMCDDHALCVVYGQSQTWDDALDKCPRLYPGAHLVDIQSAAENDALWNVAVTNNLASFNTAAKRPNGAGQYTFKWMNSGQDVAYNNWLPGNPYDATGIDDCVLVKDTNGMWNDASCTVYRSYICEV